MNLPGLPLARGSRGRDRHGRTQARRSPRTSLGRLGQGEAANSYQPRGVPHNRRHSQDTSERAVCGSQRRVAGSSARTLEGTKLAGYVLAAPEDKSKPVILDNLAKRTIPPRIKAVNADAASKRENADLNWPGWYALRRFHGTAVRAAPIITSFDPARELRACPVTYPDATPALFVAAA